jgi:hypothetical protein
MRATCLTHLNPLWLTILIIMTAVFLSLWNAKSDPKFGHWGVVLITPMPGKRGSKLPLQLAAFWERSSGMAFHHQNTPLHDYKLSNFTVSLDYLSTKRCGYDSCFLFGSSQVQISARPAIPAEGFHVFPQSSRQIWDSTKKLAYDHFFLNPLQYIIQLSPFHSVLCNLSYWKAPLLTN